MAILDHTAYPHVYQSIIDNAPRSAFPVLRATCRALQAAVDKCSLYHLALVDLNGSQSSSLVDQPAILAPDLTRVPCLAPVYTSSRLSELTSHTRVLDLVASQAWTVKDLPDILARFNAVTTVRVRFKCEPLLDLGGLDNATTVVFFAFPAIPDDAEPPNQSVFLTTAKRPGIPICTKKLVIHAGDHNSSFVDAVEIWPDLLEDIVFILPALDETRKAPLPPADEPFSSLSDHIRHVAYRVFGAAVSTYARLTVVNLAPEMETEFREAMHDARESCNLFETDYVSCISSVCCSTWEEYAQKVDPIELNEEAIGGSWLGG